MSASNQQRIIVLDTETTGMNQAQGAIYLNHRVIEIGCVELVNRRLTGRNFHLYLNPEQNIDPEATKVHGITNAFVADKDRFADIADAFIAFIQGAQLIIHNAPFDVGFLDQEFSLAKRATRIDELCQVIDSLLLAREKFPGKRNNLDALCERFGIDNSHRVHHGALLDAEILADVYLMLTGGQTHFDFSQTFSHEPNSESMNPLQPRSTAHEKTFITKVIYANEDECQAHQARLDAITKIAPCLWDKG